VNQETEEEAVLLPMVTYLCDDNAIDPDQERGPSYPSPEIQYLYFVMVFDIVDYSVIRQAIKP
jgi:hypothetical protein